MQNSLTTIQLKAQQRYLSSSKAKNTVPTEDDFKYIPSSGLRFNLKTITAVPSGFSTAQRLLDKRSRAPQELRTEEPVNGGKALVTPCETSKPLIEGIDENTGEIQRFTLNEHTSTYELEFDESQYRIGNFILQSAAREILKTETKGNESTLSGKTPIFRVCGCLRNRQSKSSQIGILKTDSGNFGYTGLQTCGSIWTCKVCASRISERRSVEIRTAVDAWLGQGHGVIFVTNTFPHSKNDDLREMLARLFDVCWNRYINHRGYKRFRKSVGYVGRIRAVEVTYSPLNGWHPHIHEIWFIEKPATAFDLVKFKETLFPTWLASTLGSGFKEPSFKHGLDVRDASAAADYISKFGKEPSWDISKELSKSHIKKGKKESITPFDMVREYAATSCKKMASLFREYAYSFFGRAQLLWSNGLKERFGIHEIKDQAIAEFKDEVTHLLASISFTDWLLVLRFDRTYRCRANLLEHARTGGADAVYSYLDWLRTKPLDSIHS